MSSQPASTARRTIPRFAEVESNVSFTLRFPSGAIANCASSYSAHEHRNIRVMGASGDR